MKRISLAALLVERDLAATEAASKKIIKSGRVWAGGFPADNPATLVEFDAHLEIKSDSEEWVSRAGKKIWDFIERDWVDPEDKICLDVGASTGGFTQALLRAGARKIYAVDVGYGQIAYKLRRDSRVVVRDRYNFRHAKKKDFSPAPELFVMDVSFISTLKLIDALKNVLEVPSRGLVLIKPQFEATTEEVGDGVIKDENLRDRIVNRVVDGWVDKGWKCELIEPSPLEGRSGNLEFIAKMILPAGG